VIVHDIRVEEPLPADLHLIHRLDTELSNDEWPRTLARFAQPVIFIAGETLRPRAAARELVTRFRHPRATKAGWLRTEDALRALWRGSHDDEPVEADLPAYLLLPRGREARVA
jgi:hypothetical protein